MTENSLSNAIIPLVVRRVLIVDDNPSIHEDFRRILRRRSVDRLAATETELFGDSAAPAATDRPSIEFELHSAFQGQEALAMVEEAVQNNRPYCLAFVDVRMPPGWDGLETIERLRAADPRIQIVICSAYSDYSWQAIHDRLGAGDWLVILRKPFDVAEIQQLACAMTEKWVLSQQASLNMATLEGLVHQHAHQLQDANEELARRNASLVEMNERLSREIHARQLADERIRHIAFHDSLTNLPNRALLTERLLDCIGRCKRQGNYRFAVLFADVDNFKIVNDSLGHRVGDQLLAHIAAAMTNAMRTLTTSIRPSLDLVARLGGDEFVVLLDDIGGADNVMAVAQRIQQAVCTPMDIGRRQITPSISIGAAINQREYDDPVEIMRDADTALYHAKGEGKGRIALFDQAMRSKVLERADVENDLRLAVQKREFVVYYQPIVSLLTGRIKWLEALVRWQHPARGLLPPDSFLPVAENAGLIDCIGQQVLEDVVGQLVDWRRRLPQIAELAVSINISAGQLVDRSLLERIDRSLEQHSLDAAALKVELTETTAMRNLELSRAVIDELILRGIEVFLDDFGTGYSSLSTLHNFPFAAIKLDKSFVTNIETDAEAETTVQAVVMIAENRHIRLIAEGVETIEQASILQDLGCEFGQGFFFARPMPPHELELLLNSDAPFSVRCTPFVESR